MDNIFFRERAIDLVLKAEGGYVNDPKDPGGETNFGISKRAYPEEDIKNLTRDRARILYHKDYWNKIKGDNLPPPIAILILDCAVNMGVNAALKILQKSLSVTIDGQIGPQTIEATQYAYVKYPYRLLKLITKNRLMHYEKLDHNTVYGNTWKQRTLEAHTLAIIWLTSLLNLNFDLADL